MRYVTDHRQSRVVLLDAIVIGWLFRRSNYPLALGRSPSLALLFGMLYLITLLISPFPLKSSNVTLKTFLFAQY